MKKLFTFFILFLCIHAKAQYVTIPDPDFVTWLQQEVPSAMNGNQMDTTDVAVTMMTDMDIYSVQDLTGIQYFDSLKTLQCFGSNITFLPVLPRTLILLNCHSNQLTSLPTLPTTLQTLDCSNNPIITLPSLPNSLTSLYCVSNSLTSLPSLPTGLYALGCNQNQISSLPSLPGSLNTLACSSNSLTSLPVLPNSLAHLFCSTNLITNLPNLPGSLITLVCDSNRFTSLPVLPASLEYLNCSNNRHLTSLPALPIGMTQLFCMGDSLVSLPPLPNTLERLGCSYNFLSNLPALPATLYDLHCQFNLLSSLPTLPAGLNFLNCSSNQLTSLPVLPVVLEDLYCNNNQLTGLPVLPSSLSSLDCSFNSISCFDPLPNGIYHPMLDNNPFTCLPNYTPHMDMNLLAYPICNPSNSTNCPSAQGIVGFVYRDLNTDCIKNTSDIVIQNLGLKIYDSSNNLLGQTASAINGVYGFLQTTGTYKIAVDTVNMPLLISCLSNNLDTTVTVASLDTNVNFALSCKPGFDIGIRSTVPYGPIFPGLTHTLTINAGDMTNWYGFNCAAGVSGTVSFSIYGPVTYISPGPGALTPGISGNIYTYTVTDFGLVNSISDFNLVFRTDTTAQIGDSICITAMVTPTAGDYNQSNNSYHFCYAVDNSYDPNIKEVYPIDVMPGYHDWFTYTIHFQNTGTAPAMNIRLHDILDNQLNLETFEVIAYSHPNLVDLTGNVLNVRFPNIMLADSTSDFDGSIGYIQYRIKPKTTWQAPYVIENTASIYFDYNAPIITNTTYNSIMTVTGLNEYKENTIKLFPNPTNGNFSLELNSKEKYVLQLVDITGNIVLLQSIDNGKATIDGSQLAPGIYNISIKGNSSINNKKLVIVK